MCHSSVAEPCTRDRRPWSYCCLALRSLSTIQGYLSQTKMRKLKKTFQQKHFLTAARSTNDHHRVDHSVDCLHRVHLGCSLPDQCRGLPHGGACDRCWLLFVQCQSGRRYCTAGVLWAGILLTLAAHNYSLSSVVILQLLFYS